jgi:hypothetical protein
VLAAEGTFSFASAIVDLLPPAGSSPESGLALTDDQVVEGAIDNGNGVALAALLSLYLNQSDETPFFDPVNLYDVLNDIEHVAITSAPGDRSSLVVTFRILCRDNTAEESLERLALLIDLVSREVGGPVNDALGLQDRNEVLRDGREITWNWTLERFDRIADRVLGR